MVTHGTRRTVEVNRHWCSCRGNLPVKSRRNLNYQNGNAWRRSQSPRRCNTDVENQMSARYRRRLRMIFPCPPSSLSISCRSHPLMRLSLSTTKAETRGTNLHHTFFFFFFWQMQHGHNMIHAPPCYLRRKILLFLLISLFISLPRPYCASPASCEFWCVAATDLRKILHWLWSGESLIRNLRQPARRSFSSFRLAARVSACPCCTAYLTVLPRYHVSKRILIVHTVMPIALHDAE